MNANAPRANPTSKPSSPSPGDASTSSGPCSATAPPTSNHPRPRSLRPLDKTLRFPVPWHCAVQRFWRPLRDVDHADDASSPFGGSPGLAQRPSGGQALDQLRSQTAAALHVKAAVDGLAAHAHARVMGEDRKSVV